MYCHVFYGWLTVLLFGDGAANISCSGGTTTPAGPTQQAHNQHSHSPVAVAVMVVSPWDGPRAHRGPFRPTRPTRGNPKIEKWPTSSGFHIANQAFPSPLVTHNVVEDSI